MNGDGYAADKSDLYGRYALHAALGVWHQALYAAGFLFPWAPRWRRYLSVTGLAQSVTRQALAYPSHIRR